MLFPIKVSRRDFISAELLNINQGDYESGESVLLLKSGTFEVKEIVP